MILVLTRECALREKAEIVRFLESEGFRVQVSESDGRVLVGVIGPDAHGIESRVRGMAGIEEVRAVAPPYPMVSREHHPGATRVKVGDVTIGGAEVIVIAGPCAVESAEQIMSAARAVARSGGRMLRGGAFKPRTSPYGFQGLGEEGLALLADARRETGLPVVTEVVAPEDVDLVARHADLLQIGSRNMQNFRLLSAVGGQHRPVLLKRGMMATVDELLFAAEYVVSAGNPRVILCERGIRTFETATRNTLDVSAIPVLRERTHLPVIVDPSHAAGRRELVPALARAGLAAGADGLIVEVHPDPSRAESDGRQSLTFDGFDAMMTDLRAIAAALSRSIAPARAVVPFSTAP